MEHAPGFRIVSPDGSAVTVNPMKDHAMIKTAVMAAGLGLALFFTGPAYAEDAAAPAGKGKSPPAARSAKSLDCSKQADAKGLHGKDRKKFRSECIHAK